MPFSIDRAAILSMFQFPCLFSSTNNFFQIRKINASLRKLVQKCLKPVLRKNNCYTWDTENLTCIRKVTGAIEEYGQNGELI